MSDVDFINQNLQQKTSDKFYTKFLGLPENSSNFLVSHLVSIDRPILTFDIADNFEKARSNKAPSVFSMNPINVMFKDDFDGLVRNLLYMIIYEQNKHTTGSFDIKIETFDNENKIRGELVIQRCWIQTIGKTPMSYSDNSESLIDVTIKYESFSIDNDLYIGL